VTEPAPSFAHLTAMSGDAGLFEHARLDRPRREHGCCTDDVARLLVVACREPRPTGEVAQLARASMRFLAEAQGTGGHVHNRRRADGRWLDRRCVEDCWGRSLWAFGTAARTAPEGWIQQAAASAFTRGSQLRSPSPRAMAFAALGAAEVLAADPHHIGARMLLADAAATIGPALADPGWPWPEPRLAYANAVLPEVLIAAGSLLERPALLADGLTLLRWLLARETRDGCYSPTPVGGSGPGDDGHGFDQQPLEAAAMADACATALRATGDPSWLDGLHLAVGWFAGQNDVGTTMWDPRTGGGYDGLEPSGPNLNQGAESTLAMVAALQHARALAAAA
jgi:hypothetical protein